MKQYAYPLDYSWTNEEMMCVIALFNAVEEAYEKGVSQVVFMEKYKQFKQVVPSIGEEKRLGREFEEVSGYSLYKVKKQAEAMNGKVIKMGENK